MKKGRGKKKRRTEGREWDVAGGKEGDAAAAADVVDIDDIDNDDDDCERVF